jgi:hypothetical protein
MQKILRLWLRPGARGARRLVAGLLPDRGASEAAEGAGVGGQGREVGRAGVREGLSG